MLKLLFLSLLLVVSSLSLCFANPEPPLPTSLRSSDAAHDFKDPRDTLIRQICHCESKDIGFSGAVYHFEYYSSMYNRTWYGDWSCHRQFRPHHYVHRWQNECEAIYSQDGKRCWDRDATGVKFCDAPQSPRRAEFRYVFGGHRHRLTRQKVYHEHPKAVKTFCEEQCLVETGLPAWLEFSHIEYYYDLPVFCPKTYSWESGKGCVRHEQEDND
jgi:hypothetical protein